MIGSLTDSSGRFVGLVEHGSFGVLWAVVAELDPPSGLGVAPVHDLLRDISPKLVFRFKPETRGTIEMKHLISRIHLLTSNWALMNENHALNSKTTQRVKVGTFT